MSACKSTSWRESGPASRNAACSFSLRPSHKQHPGFEYRISFRDGAAEDEENEAEGIKIRRVLCAVVSSTLEAGRAIAVAVADIILPTRPRIFRRLELGFFRLRMVSKFNFRFFFFFEIFAFFFLRKKIKKKYLILFYGIRRFSCI